MRNEADRVFVMGQREKLVNAGVIQRKFFSHVEKTLKSLGP